MAKAIEKHGIPVVHVCTIVPISLTVGANRILPGTAIPYPTGNPSLAAQDEFALRKTMLKRALDTLDITIAQQTVF